MASKHMEQVVRDAQPKDAEAIARMLNHIIETGIYSVFNTVFIHFRG
ncbi:hypothetical protein [Scytonema sp. NUACC21]